MNRRDLLTRALAIPAIVALPVGLRRVEKEELVWHTAAGEDIPLSKLEDDHLLNIERLLRGDGSRPMPTYWRKEYRVDVTKEVARRGLTTKSALAPQWPYDGPDDFDPWDFEDDLVIDGIDSYGSVQ